MPPQKKRRQHLSCDPGGIQTPDFQNRNLTFYSAELRGQVTIFNISVLPGGKNR